MSSAAPTAFIVGSTATARSACDYDCVWNYTVTRRTAKFVTLEDRDTGKVKRVKVHTNPITGDEFAVLGSYSMAPVARPKR